MEVRQLWSREDEARLLGFLDSANHQDPLDALYSIEGAGAPLVVAGHTSLDRWSALVRGIAEGATALSSAHALEVVLGDQLGFRGATDDYHGVRNSLLSEVLTRRRGLPILLSAVWIAAGRRAAIVVEGIGMPGHFIARVGGPGGVLVDPFEGGRVLSIDDCRRKVAQLSGGSLTWRDEFLEPSSPAQLLERVLRNLVRSYEREADAEGAYRAMRLLSALRPDAPDHRLTVGLLAEALGARKLALEAYGEVVWRFPGSREADVAGQRLGAGREPTKLN